MAGVTSPPPLPFPARGRGIEAQTVCCSAVLALVAFGVLFPVLLVVLESFQVAPPGQPAAYGLDGWRAALSEPGLRSALWNTLTVTFVRQDRKSTRLNSSHSRASRMPSSA